MRRMRIAAAVGGLSIGLAALWPEAAMAASLNAVVALAGVQGTGEKYGTIKLSDDQRGARLRATLHGLPDGPYKVELHEGSSCEIGFESHPGPEGASPLMPMPAGAAGRVIAELGVITLSPDGTTREIIEIPQLAEVASFKGHAITVRGQRLLCGVLG